MLPSFIATSCAPLRGHSHWAPSCGCVRRTAAATHGRLRMVDGFRSGPSSFRFDDTFSSTPTSGGSGSLSSPENLSEDDWAAEWAEEFDDGEGPTPELDELLGPDAPIDVIVAQNRLFFPDHDPLEALKGTEEVTLSFPLGLTIEEVGGGQLFIDEVEDGGNAQRSGKIFVNDQIIGVSLPFGDGLTLVPRQNALDEVESLIRARAADGPGAFMKLAVRRDGPDFRAAKLAEPRTGSITPEQRERIREALLRGPTDTPDADDGEDEGKQRPFAERAQMLRDAGFDMDIDVGYTPTTEEVIEAETMDPGVMDRPGDNDDNMEGYDFEGDDNFRNAIEYWKSLYDERKPPSDELF